MIYSATRQGLINAGDNPHYYLERQAVFVVLGIVVMYVVSLIDYRRLEIATTPLYVLSLLSLAGCTSLVRRPKVRCAGTASASFRFNERIHGTDIDSGDRDVLSAKTGRTHHVRRRTTPGDVGRPTYFHRAPARPRYGDHHGLERWCNVVVAGVPPRLLTLLAFLVPRAWLSRST